MLGIAISIPSILLLMAYGTRNLWITFLLGVIILIGIVGLRRSILVISIVAVLMTAGAGALIMVNPGSADVVFSRSKDFTEGRPLEKFAVDVEYNFLSRTDPIRFAQIINIIDSLGKRYAYLWGSGYGGYYEDSIVYFPWEIKSTFSQNNIDTGRFHTAHDFTILMILKYGLVGWLVITALWFIPGYTLFMMFRKKNMLAADRPEMLHDIMICMTAFLPTAMLQTYWSGKGLFINGMIIASCIEFARQYPNYATAKNRHVIQQRMVLK